MNDSAETPLLDSPPDEKLADIIKDQSLADLRQKLEIERFRDDIEQNLECCLCPNKTDKRLVVLGSQLLISILIVCFCFFKLAVSGEADSEQVYVTLLTSVFSYWTGRSTSSGSKLG